MSRGEEPSRSTDPTAAVAHVRRFARETAATVGHRAAADALLHLRREYRVMPLQRSRTPADRLAAWDAVRAETGALVPLAMGTRADNAMFDERVATPADQPLPGGPTGRSQPSAALQAAALSARTASAPRPTPLSATPPVDRTPAR